MSFSIVPLGELCDMDRRGIHPDDPTASHLPFIGVENVESDSGVIYFGNGSRTGNQRSTTFQFDQRHVLYAKLRPYLNKVATPALTGRCSTELVPLLPRSGVDREFVAYLLRRKETVEYVMASVTGSRMPRTDMKALMLLPVPLPSLDEQRRVVGILNRAAKIERLRAHGQELMGKLIPVLFIKMFGDPVDNPMGWVTRRVGEIGSVGSGIAFPKKEQGKRQGDTPFLKVSDMNHVGNDTTILSWTNAVSDETRAKLRARVFPTGSVIFPKVGAAIATNKKRMLGCPSCIDNNIMSIVPGAGLDSRYLYGLMLQKDLSDFASNAEPPSMRKTTVENWQIPCPPLALQRSYAGIVDAIRVAAEVAGSASETASSLTASLMSRLLRDGA